MKYIFKKIITALITIIAVSFLVFLAFEIIPGDVATKMLGTNATQSQVEALRARLGLDRPFLARYFGTIKDFFAGDMGTSYTYYTPVKTLLADKLPITLTLTAMSFIFIIILSIPLGILTAKYYDRFFARIIDVINQLCMSVPPFFIGILFTYLFGIIFKWFVPGGFVSYKTDFFGYLGYMVIPSLSIAVPKAAMNMRLLKNSVLSESKLDYVRTAYSRGNSTNRILYRHVLKNALIPVVTFLGMTLSDIVAGSLIIEQVFSIPGFGRLLISSISNRDYPVAQSIVVIIAIVVIITNLCVDIVYTALDPRIRDEK